MQITKTFFKYQSFYLDCPIYSWAPIQLQLHHNHHWDLLYCTCILLSCQVEGRLCLLLECLRMRSQNITILNLLYLILLHRNMNLIHDKLDYLTFLPLNLFFIFIKAMSFLNPFGSYFSCLNHFSASMTWNPSVWVLFVAPILSLNLK